MTRALRQRTIYIPYMCDHAYVLQAALEAFGISAQVLPEPDDESTRLGLDLVLGKECAPCMITVGEVIRLSRTPGFDPAAAALMLPTAPGPCRFGQYTVLQRHLFDEQGLGDMEILSPSSGSSYEELGDNPLRLRMHIWDGIVAVDLLQQLLHRYRPYETRAGAADSAYAEGLDQIIGAVRARRSVLDVLRRCGSAFAALEVDESERRPLIGVVGEIYVRFNRYTNQDLLRRVERLGGEVLLASMMEWLYLTTWNPGYYAKLKGDYRGFLLARLTESYQRHRERRLARPLAQLLRHRFETPTRNVKRSIAPYLPPMVETEAVLTLGKAIEVAQRGACGVLAVMPFSCMPGIVSAALAPRVRQDLGNVPWLDVSFDLQKSTNIETRLEAFMSQAHNFQRQLRATGQAA